MQRSIVTNDPRGELVLLYNKDRSIFMEGPMIDEFKNVFGDKLKVYIECEIVTGEDGNDKLEIIRELENQNW